MIEALIRTHLSRYPMMEIMDVYRLLHQATFGVGHPIARAKNEREWLEEEAALYAPAFDQDLLEDIGIQGEWVRLHLRPYRAYGGSLEGLLDAYIRSAETVSGSAEGMTLRWSAFEKMVTGDAQWAARWNPWEVQQFGRVRLAEKWAAMPHSPAYVQRYRPCYRVLTTESARQLCAAQGIRL